MSEIRSKIEKLEDKIAKSKAPTINSGVHLLPVSHDEFQARWSLSQQALEAGIEAAAESREDAHLVLRAFSLPEDADRKDFSSTWHDFQIDGTASSAYFTLPAPTPKINAAVGIMNKSGRFRPLARGDAVTLPSAPNPPAGKADVPPSPDEPETKTSESAEPALTENEHPGDRRPPAVLNEAEVSERLERITGLPEDLKSRPDPLSKTGYRRPKSFPKKAHAQPSGETASRELNETEILKTVRNKMALEPEPNIEKKESAPLPENEGAESGEPPHPGQGASEQLASQWEEIWTERAPVELRAEYTLTGKIAPGMKLLLGNEIVHPAPGGFIVWKRKLDSFNQIWPLLNAALSNPSVNAGPSLEFFKDVSPDNRLLELNAALEIEGKVTDPNYYGMLPDQLQPDGEGKFKLYRMLPDGAVILPSISLVAG